MSDNERWCADCTHYDLPEFAETCDKCHDHEHFSLRTEKVEVTLKVDNSDKYCRDCKHYSVNMKEAPCCNCFYSKEYFEPITVSVAPRRRGIAKAKLTTEPDGQANIHKRTADIVEVRPANPYEGIDHALLKRVRDIMQAYHDINEEYIDEPAKQQLQHDIDIINSIVGYSLEHLRGKLLYILSCTQDIQISTNGGAMPHVNADELEAIKSWVFELDTQE